MPETEVKVVKQIKYKLNSQGTFEGRHSHLFIEAGTKPKQIAADKFDVSASAWSHNEKTATFVANIQPDPDTSEVTNIYTAPSSGGEPRKLTDGGEPKHKEERLLHLIRWMNRYP
jgi:hypothetical protein